MKRSAESVYQRFVNFEEQAAEIYFQLAAHFGLGNKELSSLWLDMGMQEKEHAELLQFCLDESLFASPLPEDAEIQKLDDLFISLRIRAADAALSISDAFQIAAGLETSEVNTIHCYLTNTLHTSMYRLRSKTSISMPDHVEYLMREGNKLGVYQDTLMALDPHGKPSG
jgi:hypothetical protein